MAKEEYNNNRLLELTGSDYEIVDGEPDIRGWVVNDTQGRKMGKVIDLLFDPSSERVYYIVIDVEYENHAAELEKQVMFPIAIAEFRQEKDAEAIDTPTLIFDDSDNPENIPFHDGTKSSCEHGVVVAPITLRQIMDLPTYDPDSLNSSTELAVHKVLESTLKSYFEKEEWERGRRVRPKSN